MDKDNKDIKDYNRYYIKIRSKLGIKPVSIHQELMLALGEEAAPHYTTVTRWVNEFAEGRDLIEDRKRNGRPVSETTMQNVDRISEIIRRNPSISFEQIEVETGLSHNVVQYIVHDILKMRKAIPIWKPQQEQQQQIPKKHLTQSLSSPSSMLTSQPLNKPVQTEACQNLGVCPLPRNLTYYIGSSQSGDCSDDILIITDDDDDEDLRDKQKKLTSKDDEEEELWFYSDRKEIVPKTSLTTSESSSSPSLRSLSPFSSSSSSTSVTSTRQPRVEIKTLVVDSPVATTITRHFQYPSKYRYNDHESAFHRVDSLPHDPSIKNRHQHMTWFVSSTIPSDRIVAATSNPNSKNICHSSNSCFIPIPK